MTASAAQTSPRKRTGNGATRRIDADEIGLDALVGHAGYAVRRFQIWIFQDFIKTLGDVDIRPTQYSVLTVIGANPGLSQMAVAKRLGIERARLVHLLDSLEQRKLVKRIKSKADRRSHALHLTARARRRWPNSSGSPPSTSGMSRRRSARPTGSGCFRSSPASPDPDCS